MDELPRLSTGKIDRKQLILLAKSYASWTEKILYISRQVDNINHF